MTQLEQRIRELAENNPNMRRTRIALEAKCSTSMVTKILGSVRPYKLRHPKENVDADGGQQVNGG